MKTTQRLARFATYALTALTLLYTLSLFVLSAVWTWAPERTWWLALSNIFAPFFFLPLLVFLPLALVLRSRTMGVMLALVVLLFGVQFGTRLLPTMLRQEQPASSATATQVRVVTFNQLYSNNAIPDTLKVLKAQQADIVALQELSITMAEAIKGDPELQKRYPYHTLWSSESWWGVGVLSRYPIEHETPAKDFNGQIMTLDMDGQEIHFINIHPPAPTVDIRRMRDVPLMRDLPGVRQLPMVRSYMTRRRNEQLQGLLDVVDRTQGPLIVAGDFNTADRDRMHAALASRLLDAYAETNRGFGLTFPNPRHANRVPLPFPLVRIDYVWSHNGIAPTATRVVCDAAGSDHCMVVADLVVTK